MKAQRFAEFYHWNVGKSGIIPACGSDSVLPLDGRHGLPRAIKAAHDTAKRRGYVAFRVCHGTFTDNRPLTGLIKVE